MPLYEGHDCGALLTQDIVGKTLYSHYDACQGELTRLYVTEVTYTHTYYRNEGGGTGSFATGNRGEGARNWEAVTLEIAAAEIHHFFSQEKEKEEAELAALQQQLQLVEAQIRDAQETTPTHAKTLKQC